MPVNCDNDGAKALFESAPPPLNQRERTVPRGVAPRPRPLSTDRPISFYLSSSSPFPYLSIPKNIFHLSNYIYIYIFIDRGTRVEFESDCSPSAVY